MPSSVPSNILYLQHCQFGTDIRRASHGLCPPRRSARTSLPHRTSLRRSLQHTACTLVCGDCTCTGARRICHPLSPRSPGELLHASCLTLASVALHHSAWRTGSTLHHQTSSLIRTLGRRRHDCREHGAAHATPATQPRIHNDCPRRNANAEYARDCLSAPCSPLATTWPTRDQPL